MVAYFDASAFVKLAITEPHTDEVRAAWDGAQRRLSSQLLYAEARAALARAVRMSRLASPEAAAARALTELLWGGVERVVVTQSLVQRAGDLAEEHGLRGYDAVHLASFEEIADERTVLVASDGDLVSAATARGFLTLPLPA